MNQLLMVHEVADKTILIIDRTLAPRVVSATAAVTAAAEVVSRMMQTELIASLGSQQVYQIHDNVELGVLVHIDFVRNRANIIEWAGGTDLGARIVEHLEILGYNAERYQVGTGSYLHTVLSGHCLVFDEQAVVLACMSAADYDDLAA